MLLGIPLHFWNLDLFKVIGTSCGEFISLAEATTTRSRMGVATLLISSLLNPIPSCLHLKVNSENVLLQSVENAIEVKMAKEEDDDATSKISGN